MTFNVLADIRIETPEGVITLNPGQLISLSKADAIPLIEAGLITPTERVAYKIYSEILEAYLWVVYSRDDMRTLRVFKGTQEPIYTLDDCQRLQGIDSAFLRQIHKVKDVFPESTIEQITKKVKDAKNI